MPALDPQAEAQLDLLQLLVSMYMPSELVLSDPTQTLYEQYQDDPSALSSDDLGEALDAELSLPLDEFDQGSGETVTFQIALPLRERESSERRVEIRLRQPTWLNRTAYESVLELIRPPSAGEESSEYLLNTIDDVRSTLKGLHSAAEAQAQEDSRDRSDKENDHDHAQWVLQDVPVDRVWFWFPTLSTKEKRADLVNFANEWKLTGFVLAGKPALLCVEGPGQLVEKYMSRIKSESWSDIPPHHKKVSERFRRPLPSASSRAFTEMSEITHLIPKYGQYNHRGDMSEVKRLMEAWGVGDDFGAAVMGSA